MAGPYAVDRDATITLFYTTSVTFGTGAAAKCAMWRSEAVNKFGVPEQVAKTRPI
jgi:hypothetical protein